tara:strand:+ start:205 stop:441 length:237 start_codon:yes stop_codon:yes gene_type:complete
MGIKTKKSLDNKETVFTLLAALIKKAGGAVKISEEELVSVAKNDVVVMLFDRNTNDIILKIVKPTDTKGKTKGESLKN